MAVENIQELSDGRWGVFRDGLCIHVERSREEALAWWKRAVADHKGDSGALGRAIGKLK